MFVANNRTATIDVKWPLRMAAIIVVSVDFP
jgi:hypothetical protein